MRFELTAPTLARLCSTPELRPLYNFSSDLYSTPLSLFMDVLQGLDRLIGYLILPILLVFFGCKYHLLL